MTRRANGDRSRGATGGRGGLDVARVGVLALGLILSLSPGRDVAAAPAAKAASSTKEGAKAKPTSKPAKGDAKPTSGERPSAKGTGKVTTSESPAPASTGDPALDRFDARVAGLTEVVKAAAKAAKVEEKRTAEELAARIVEARLMLDEGDAEPAAIIFYDIVLNFADAPAAPEARYYLGEALVRLDMPGWAVECLVNTLADRRPAAKPFHQRAVARLLELATPSRESGFARKAGLSAMPETRGRLRSLGLPVVTAPPQGVVGTEDAARLVAWVRSYKPEERRPELRYAYGRYLYLTRSYADAIAELDALSPLDIPLTQGGPEAAYRVRAAYMAAAAATAIGKYDDALARLAGITKANPRAVGDREIVDLAWLGRARIHHDLGEFEPAIAAYRRIGRGSPLFHEAVYETAWTLMRADRYEQASAAIDLALLRDPHSPVAPELAQLRGKIRVHQRDWEGATEAFTALRGEFEGAARGLRQTLALGTDAADYFTAVIAGAQMEHFTLDRLLPSTAAPIARRLDQARAGEALTQELGAVTRELRETRELLTRMEEALRAREQARLFTDLSAHLSALDRADEELAGLAGDLASRAADANGRYRINKARADGEQRLSAASQGRGEESRKRLRALEGELAGVEAVISELRAGLLAAERYYRESRAQKEQDPTRATYLTQATELHRELAAHERDAAALRGRVEIERVRLRFGDPSFAARREVVASLRAFMSQMYAAGKPDAAARERSQQLARLDQQIKTVRAMLARAAAQRLRAATAIIREERQKLDAYQIELEGLRDRSLSALGELMQATFRDVSSELAHWQIRSEVGLLDVAWAIKQAESETVHKLERARDQDLRALTDAVEEVLQ
ncbi:MAG: hypothetical protein R3A51_02915 [Nannocystaceae bacterium]|nr:hypothetical protein [Myxococcales bacterium]